LKVASKFLWILAYGTVFFGFLLGLIGAYLEASQRGSTGLYLIVLCGVFLALSSIFATLAAKRQAEEKQK